MEHHRHLGRCCSSQCCIARRTHAEEFRIFAREDGMPSGHCFPCATAEGARRRRHSVQQMWMAHGCEGGQHLVVVAALQLAQVWAQAAICGGQLLLQALYHLVGLHGKHRQAPPAHPRLLVFTHSQDVQETLTWILACNLLAARNRKCGHTSRLSMCPVRDVTHARMADAASTRAFTIR